jgi:peptide/nickel transport system permease protein
MRATSARCRRPARGIAMLRYTLRRVAFALLILWFVSLLVFLLLRLLPGEPLLLPQGMTATPERVEQARRDLGLDRPLGVQYLDWARGVATLDLGRSTVTGASVGDELRHRLPVSLQLMAMTIGWTVLLGVPLGVIAAAKRNRPPDAAIRAIAVLAIAVPSFWLATLVLLVPQQLWGYAPPLDGARGLFEDPRGNLAQFVPASLVLALATGAVTLRLTRAALLEVLHADYVRTARAKGLPERMVLIRHGLRNALIPVVTLVGLQVAALLSGAVIIEQIFNLGGLGQYVFAAILQQDYAVAQTLVLYTAGAVVLANLIVDLAYAWLDPRIRYA